MRLAYSRQVHVLAAFAGEGPERMWKPRGRGKVVLTISRSCLVYLPLHRRADIITLVLWLDIFSLDLYCYIYPETLDATIKDFRVHVNKLLQARSRSWAQYLLVCAFVSTRRVDILSFIWL